MKIYGFLAVSLLAAPALAQDYVGFRSPTGNIHCAMYSWEGGTEARCDLRELTPSYRKFPGRVSWIGARPSG